MCGKDVRRPMMPTNDNQHSVSAWGISLVVHGVAVAAAIAFAAQVKPVLQQEIFQWDVALVERVKTDSRPERAEPVVERAKPVAQAAPRPVERQETKRDEVIKEPEVRETPREKPAMIEPVTTAQADVAPAPSPTQTVPEQHPESVVTASALSPAAVESAPASSAVQEESTIVPATPEVRDRTPLVAAAPRAAKADYSWLVDSLGRRLAALTRYPNSARLNGWEGRVVLRAIIRADGHLLDVKVHKSSGHDALDRAALETIKLACPLHMKHTLDSTEVAIYVPIVYSLAG